MGSATLSPWLGPLLACPHCGHRLSLPCPGEGEPRPYPPKGGAGKGAYCLGCGRAFPLRAGLLDLRAGRERAHLWAINRLPPVALLYDAWRVRSTALLSRGRLALAEELKRLRAWLLPTGGPFLDVGTGTGLYREALGERAVGLDPSPAFLWVAARRRPGPYLLAHGEALPFRSGSFGGVAIGPTWNEFTEPRRAAREARRVLWPGGRLFALLLLGPGPGLGLWRPRPEDFLCSLEEAGFTPSLEIHGTLGLALAEAR